MSMQRLDKQIKSRDSLSDLEEEVIDYKKLATHEIYESRKPLIVGRHFVSSEVVAYESFNRILNNAVDIIYEKYVLSKMNPHIISGTSNLMELILSSHFSIYDTESFSTEEDSEPKTSTVDTWGRSKINTKKLADIPVQEGTKPTTAMSTMSEDKKNLLKAREKARKFITDVQHEPIPAPIDLREPEESNKTEDDMRALKEREVKRREEEAAAEKLKKQQEQQSKYSKKEADLKKKPFTYDYNGNIILVHQPKTDKMPPSAFMINYSIPQPEDDAGKKKDKKRNTKDVNALKTKLKKAPEADKEFITKLGSYTTPPLFDMISPEKGVIFTEGGRVKRGTNKASAVTLTSGTLTSTDGGPIRLTRTEYLQLTRGGNLSRPATDRDGGMRQITETSQPGANWTIKSDAIKEVDFRKAKSIKMANENRAAGKGIKDINYNAFETLIRAAEEDPTDTIKTAPTQFQHQTERFTVDDTLKKSPIDTFNLEIINSKDWGKAIGSGYANSLPKLPDHKEKQLKQTLGIKPKYPRERAINLPMSKSQSEFLIKTIKG